MSSRPLFKPHAVIVNGDMSGDITSQVTVIQTLSMMSYSLSWVGTSPVGTAEVQVSNDYALGATGAVVNAGTWNTINLQYQGNAVSTIPITGNVDHAFIDIDELGAFAVRLKFTHTSGTGTLQVVFNAKVS